MSDLQLTQRWFQGLVVSDESAVEASSDSIEQKINSVYGLTARRRLEIYRSMYPLRMVEAMGIDYPGVRRAMGDRAFASAVMDYVQVHPSRSWTLDHLGHAFPSYLAGRKDLSRRAFLQELARLELALCEVFHAAPPEKRPSWLEIDPALWGDVFLIPAHTSRLLKSCYPVSRYLNLASQDDEVKIPGREVELVLICRPDFHMRRMPLEPFAYELLADLFRGRTLETALTRLARRHPAVDGQTLRKTFAKWAALQVFGGYRLRNDQAPAKEVVRM